MLLWILFLNIFTFSYGVRSKAKFYKLEHVSICENNDDLAIDTKGLTISFDKNTLKFHGTMEVKEELDGILETELAMYKCKGVDFGCELFSNNTHCDLCTLFSSSDSEMGLFGLIKPKLKCPIEPGEYDLNEVISNMEMISNLPLEGFLWHVLITSFRGEDDEREMVSCFSVYVRVFISTRRKS